MIQPVVVFLLLYHFGLLILGMLFFENYLFKDFDNRFGIVKLIFCFSFVLCVSLLSILIFQMLGVINPSLQIFIWYIDILFLILLVYLIIPVSLIYTYVTYEDEHVSNSLLKFKYFHSALKKVKHKTVNLPDEQKSNLMKRLFYASEDLIVKMKNYSKKIKKKKKKKIAKFVIGCIIFLPLLWFCFYEISFLIFKIHGDINEELQIYNMDNLLKTVNSEQYKEFAEDNDKYINKNSDLFFILKIIKHLFINIYVTGMTIVSSLSAFSSLYNPYTNMNNFFFHVTVKKVKNIEKKITFITKELALKKKLLLLCDHPDLMNKYAQNKRVIPSFNKIDIASTYLKYITTNYTDFGDYHYYFNNNVSNITTNTGIKHNDFVKNKFHSNTTLYENDSIYELNNYTTETETTTSCYKDSTPNQINYNNISYNNNNNNNNNNNYLYNKNKKEEKTNKSCNKLKELNVSNNKCATYSGMENCNSNNNTYNNNTYNDKIKNDQIKNDKIKNEQIKNDQIKNDQIKNEQIKNNTYYPKDEIEYIYSMSYKKCNLYLANKTSIYDDICKNVLMKQQGVGAGVSTKVGTEVSTEVSTEVGTEVSTEVGTEVGTNEEEKEIKRKMTSIFYKNKKKHREEEEEEEEEDIEVKEEVKKIKELETEIIKEIQIIERNESLSLIKHDQHHLNINLNLNSILNISLYHDELQQQKQFTKDFNPNDKKLELQVINPNISSDIPPNIVSPFIEDLRSSGNNFLYKRNVFSHNLSSDNKIINYNNFQYFETLSDDKIDNTNVRTNNDEHYITNQFYENKNQEMYNDEYNKGHNNITRTNSIQRNKLLQHDRLHKENNKDKENRKSFNFDKVSFYKKPLVSFKKLFKSEHSLPYIVKNNKNLSPDFTSFISKSHISKSLYSKLLNPLTTIKSIKNLFFSRIENISKKKKEALKKDINSLDYMSKKLYFLLDEVIKEQIRINASTTLWGIFLYVLQIGMSILCVYKIIKTCYIIYMVEIYYRFLATHKEGHVLTLFYAKVVNITFIRNLENVLDMAHINIKLDNYVKSITSIILLCFIFTNIKNFMEKIIKLKYSTNSSLYSNLAILLMCEIMDLYFSAYCIHLFDYLPFKDKKKLLYIFFNNNIINLFKLKYHSDLVYVFSLFISLILIHIHHRKKSEHFKEI
ncbi:conserved membrane protein, unknown function [Hepatocystis sp. ex Piliocolobus tephrosceles]|nr:conserved membrane protein, unknown function [Hepatocystis sp. ex Piliocolobus tephrosceles]